MLKLVILACYSIVNYHNCSYHHEELVQTFSATCSRIRFTGKCTTILSHVESRTMEFMRIKFMKYADKYADETSEIYE